jgi:hypothetical protein
MVANLAPAIAQMSMSAGLLANAKAAVALIGCGDPTHPTYRSGVVAGSDGVHTYVVTVSAIGTCYPARVFLSDDLAHAYPAQALTPNSNKLFDARVPGDLALVLSIEHATTHVARFATSAPAAAIPFVAIGFPTGVAGVKPATPIVDGGSTTSTNSLFIDAQAARALDYGATFFDPATGEVIGLLSAIAPGALSFEPAASLPPKREYTVVQSGRVRTLLDTMDATIAVESVGQMEANNRDAQTVAAMRRYTFVIMKRDTLPGRQYTFDAAGFAVALGSTATTTVLASLVDPATIGDVLLAIPDRDGNIQKVQPAVVARDAASFVTLLSIPRIDVTPPAFVKPRPPGATVLQPYLEFCSWQQTIGALQECPIALKQLQVTPSQIPDAMSLSGPLVIGIETGGAPILAPIGGSLVGIDAGNVIIPAATLQRVLNDHALGITVNVRP